MKRLLLGLCCVFLIASTSIGAEKKGLGSLWPFGRDTKQTQGLGNPQSPPFGSDASAKKKPGFEMPSFPSPTKMLSKMEQGTDKFFAKTRSTMKSFQDFGRSLVPPVLKSQPNATPKPDRSFSSIFKTKPEPSKEGPQTAADWHSMPRPGF